MFGVPRQNGDDRIFVREYGSYSRNLPSRRGQTASVKAGASSPLRTEDVRQRMQIR